MILILDEAYLGNVKRVKDIFLTSDEKGAPLLKMDYVSDEGKGYTFTSTSSNRDYLKEQFKSLVQQIKAQDKAFVDQAFEDTVLK